MSLTSSAKKEQGISNLKQAGRNFQDAGREAAEEAGNTLIEKAEHAGEEVRRYVSDVSQKVAHASSDLEQTIKDKPMQSTLVALCAGVVLGMLFRR